MIKLFAFDLDGTLLNGEHSIDSDTLKFIKGCGIKYIIVTGRNYGMTKHVVSDFGLDCDLILNNGHEYISKDKSVHITHPFPFERLEKVSKILNKYNFHTTFHDASDKKFTFYDIDFYFSEHIRMASAMHGKDVSKLEDVRFFNKEYFTRNAYKIDDIGALKTAQIVKIDAKTLDLDIYDKAVLEFQDIGGVNLSCSFEGYLEVCDDIMDKGRMLFKIADMYGIAPDEIAAFGDSDNDTEMLTMIKHSFAMGNATEEIKKIARYITDTNLNQGVLKGIHKILAEQNGL